MRLDLVCLDLGPENAFLLKRPFRVRISAPLPDALPRHRYLLVRELSGEGGTLIDAEGKTQAVTADFILRHWGSKVSWFFPYKKEHINLSMGMRSSAILEVQQTLTASGYPVALSGVFDEQTFREIIRFQKKFGLEADGIVGPMTRAVLYLMG